MFRFTQHDNKFFYNLNQSMPDKKLWLLFFWRLDDEKWFWLILDMLYRFIKETWTIPFSLYVFGKGKYVKDLLDLSAKYNSIHFFGRQSLETISRYKENCQFCLMPSTFLETFGLVALNALDMWIPVVWFAKWWLKQFIPAKYDISNSRWKNDTEKVYTKIQELLVEFNNDCLKENSTILIDRSKKAQNLAKKYDKDQRLKNIQEIIWKPKRVLLISDFKSKLWGIETYIYDVKDILTSHGYEVKIYGAKIPSGKIWQLIKYFGLFFAMRNFIDAIKLQIVARKFKPKVIRYHSTIRWIWRLPIKLLSYHNSKKLMMYHDLWYFHPFPSKVTSEDMILTPINLSNFIKSANTKNPIKLLAIWFKYLSVKLLKTQLKKYIDYHLVPSSFMESIVAKSYDINPKKVQTLSHFIQK